LSARGASSHRVKFNLIDSSFEEEEQKVQINKVKYAARATESYPHSLLSIKRPSKSVNLKLDDPFVVIPYHKLLMQDPQEKWQFLNDYRYLKGKKAEIAEVEFGTK